MLVGGEHPVASVCLTVTVIAATPAQARQLGHRPPCSCRVGGLRLSLTGTPAPLWSVSMSHGHPLGGRRPPHVAPRAGFFPRPPGQWGHGQPGAVGGGLPWSPAALCPDPGVRPLQGHSERSAVTAWKSLVLFFNKRARRFILCGSWSWSCGGRGGGGGRVYAPAHPTPSQQIFLP